MGWSRSLLFAALFFTVLTVLPTPATCCGGTSPKIGNMTRDMDVEVGSSFTLTCTLFTHSININGTDYRITSEDLLLKFGNVSLDDIDIIDDFSVQYTIFNASVNDTGYYNCFVSSPLIHFNPFICATYIAVGFKPLPVENFSCISFNYERLNCSWKLPFNPVKTKYELWDYLKSIFRRPCPTYDDQSCEWRLDTSPPYRKSPRQLQFVLEGHNSLGENKQFITLNHFQIIKPAAPQKMLFQSVGKTSLQLHWLPPKGMEYDNIRTHLDYWIHYCRMDGLYPELCGAVNTKAETTTDIFGLIPSTTYKFMLRCKVNVSDSYWSAYLNSTITTEPDVPYLAPETASSSFEVQNLQNSRRITLYWKPVPAQFENGENFGYVIKYHMYYIRHRSKRSTPDRVLETGNRTTHTFRDMDPNSAYLFRIFSRNSFGISSNFSVIVVDKADNMPPGPKDISVLSLGQGNYNISWKSVTPSANGVAGNYTLYFCQNIKPRPFECEGPIEWRTVHGTHQEVKLSDYNTNYQFAVAYNAHHSTSGMKWAVCVVPYGGVLHKVRDVVVTPDSATSIRVYWTLDCSAQKDVVKEYAISYCPVHSDLSCSEKMSRISVTDPHSEQHVVGSLHPFTQYKFIVTARTSVGWSENSDVRYETTMSAAPEDPPRDVDMLSVNGTSITVSFKPPSQPNGKITRYVIFYGPSSIPVSEMKRVEYIPDGKKDLYIIELKRRDISFYTNYTVFIEACVGLACSNLSEPVHAFTGIGNPSPIDQPHAEVINATLVNITWKPPSMPNGPIDMYILTMRYIESIDQIESEEVVEVFNVTAHETSMVIPVDCQPAESEGVSYVFNVRAMNVRNGMALYGPESEPIQAKLCFVTPAGLSTRVLVGLIIGVAFGLAILMLLMYSLAKWMKKEVDTLKGIQVQLPRGLDSPMENPLNNYDKFKNGLQMNRDAGIPSEGAYKRLCSYSSSDKLSKHLESSYDASSEEFLSTKGGREKNGRNRSGDSSLSGKGHDSISSSNTNKTHTSIDSGAEVDLPPSPDGIFSETSSSNTTPRSYKPDLEIVEENHPSSNSKDSGLERESMSPRAIRVAKVTDIPDMSSKCPYYIRKKNPIYFNPLPLKKNDQMQPYSKFTIISPAFTSSYVSVGVHSLNLLDQQSLANSEPSVAEFPDDSDSEPLMLSGVPPYCRFGLARSVGNGLNITNQAFPVQQNLGYSKFGIIYSAIRKPATGEPDVPSVLCAPSYSRVTQPKMAQSLVGNAVDVFGRPVGSSCQQKSPRQKPLDVLEEKPDNVSCSDIELLEDEAKATTVKKCAIPSSLPCSVASVGKASTNAGYVSFNQALTSCASPDNNAVCSNRLNMDGPEDESMCNEEDEETDGVDAADISISVSVPNDVPIITGKPDLDTGPDPVLDSSVIQSTPAQPKRSSYVSFQDAKVMARYGQSSDEPVLTNGGLIEMPALGISEDVNDASFKYKMNCSSLPDSLSEVPHSPGDNLGTRTDSVQFPGEDSQEDKMACSPPTQDAETVDLVDLISDLPPSPLRIATDSEQVVLQNGGSSSLPSEILPDNDISECFDSICTDSVNKEKPRDRTLSGQNSVKAPHSATNGYVTWNELICNGKSQNPADIVTVPCSTSDMHGERV